ncbi:M28 family metallopeptidase [Seonamhaeicola maritimus]|uniref:M20/M25/M40 family metallo-hydrolase n=1 Tax=Seonamhaeicola maritimus TaxID=2591822 RepID=A0A5C7GFQ0_9FLAO|nr:M20/M25/M40 family metallo-hydrolase [Seonamhaeicola maritimus]TXG35893.1 M20/M25/M40 family metallo-hydrolase [Seonamhaeicola maritimus]
MYKTLLLVLTVLLTTCVKPKSNQSSNNDSGASETSVPSQNISSKEKEITLEESIKSSMEYLASDELEGRSTGTNGIEKAAIFIEAFFKKNDVKPYFTTYRDSFKIKKIVGYNVVGLVEGNDPKLKDEYVILGAHYDHIEFQKAINGDSIANGANDDASGTVAVMEWAKHFAKSKSNKRSILFTLYAAEEMGLKGSQNLAKRLKKEKLNLYTMINFEMIGVPRAKDQIMAYVTGYEKSNISEMFNEYAGSEIVGFFSDAKAYSLFMRSDNYPFYQQFGIPAHAISTFDFTNFDYYHHVDDEVDKLDYTHMTNFINSMIPAIEGMTISESKEIKMNNDK